MVAGPPQPLIHHADTRLTTSLQIYRAYQPYLISRNVFTTPHSKGCSPSRASTHDDVIVDRVGMQETGGGYKLPFIITSVDKSDSVFWFRYDASRCCVLEPTVICFAIYVARGFLYLVFFK